MPSVYLDHAATTPLSLEVFEAMVPWMTEYFGNPSSVHALGRAARTVIEESREQVATHLNAQPSEIVFTSSGTESNNLALGRTGHVVTSTVEHKSILEPLSYLENSGHRVTRIPPGDCGSVSPGSLAEAMESDTRLVSLIHTNNETGAITDLPNVSQICRERGATLHTDAVQAASYGILDVEALGVDLMSLSGHKINGPRGVGVLYVRTGVRVDPLLSGGSQERGRRGGTENTAAIVGMARALELARARCGEAQRVAALRDRLKISLTDTIGSQLVINTPHEAAPHVLNVAFKPTGHGPIDGEMLILNLDLEGIMVSAGSACTSGAMEPSHVLMGLGLERATAQAAIRFSLGHSTTADEIDYVVQQLTRIVRRMRP